MVDVWVVMMVVAKAAWWADVLVHEMVFSLVVVKVARSAGWWEFYWVDPLVVAMVVVMADL